MQRVALFNQRNKGFNLGKPGKLKGKKTKGVHQENRAVQPGPRRQGGEGTEEIPLPGLEFSGRQNYVQEGYGLDQSVLSTDRKDGDTQPTASK